LLPLSGLHLLHGTVCRAQLIPRSLQLLLGFLCLYTIFPMLSGRLLHLHPVAILLFFEVLDMVAKLVAVASLHLVTILRLKLIAVWGLRPITILSLELIAVLLLGLRLHWQNDPNAGQHEHAQYGHDLTHQLVASCWHEASLDSRLWVLLFRGPRRGQPLSSVSRQGFRIVLAALACVARFDPKP
jgi:hypothetical protein